MRNRTFVEVGVSTFDGEIGDNHFKFLVESIYLLSHSQRGRNLESIELRLIEVQSTCEQGRYSFFESCDIILFGGARAHGAPACVLCSRNFYLNTLVIEKK